MLSVPLANGEIPAELSNELSLDGTDLKSNHPVQEIFNPPMSHISEHVSLAMDVDSEKAEISLSVPLETSQSPSQERRGEHLSYSFLHNQTEQERIPHPNSPVHINESTSSTSRPFATNGIGQEMISTETSIPH